MPSYTTTTQTPFASYFVLADVEIELFLLTAEFFKPKVRPWSQACKGRAVVKVCGPVVFCDPKIPKHRLPAILTLGDLEF
jgi:hypothetical protein